MVEAITQEPAPALPSDSFSSALCSFVEKMLQRNPADRATAQELLRDPFLAQHENCRRLTGVVNVAPTPRSEVRCMAEVRYSCGDFILPMRWWFTPRLRAVCTPSTHGESDDSIFLYSAPWWMSEQDAFSAKLCDKQELYPLCVLCHEGDVNSAECKAHDEESPGAPIPRCT